MTVLLRKLHHNFLGLIHGRGRRRGRLEGSKQRLRGYQHRDFVVGVRLDSIANEQRIDLDLSIPGDEVFIIVEKLAYSRPDLNSALIRVIIADDMHGGLCKLDNAFLLQFLYGLDDLCAAVLLAPYNCAIFLKNTH